MNRPTCPDHPHAGPEGCYGCLVCEGERLALADKRRSGATYKGKTKKRRRAVLGGGGDGPVTQQNPRSLEEAGTMGWSP